MSENCDKCKERNVGCDVIQQMNRDIAKLRKRKSFVALFWGFLLFAFIMLAAVIVWSNFCTKKAVTASPINVQLNVADTKKLTSALDKDTINKVLQETAQQAFYQGRFEAQSEYDKNFTTILTILTIFGIAWPVVIALLQYKLNSEEMTKIATANKNSESAIIENIKLRKEMYYMIADNYYLNAIFWGNEMTRAKEMIRTEEMTPEEENNLKNSELNGRRCHTRAMIKMIYFYALSGRIGQANSKVGPTIARLKEMQSLTDDQKTLVIDEIDWNKFQSIGIKQAREIKQLSDNVFCKLRPVTE